MKKRIQTLEQLKDSRLLFDKQIPAFGYMLIVIVAVFLVGAVVWSMNTPKVYTIQAQGTVTNTDASYVMCTYTGEIETSYMEEGKLVEIGDTLFTIKSTDYNLQKVQLEDSRIAYEKQISQYQKLVKSIKDNITKEVPITVKVATDGIKVNNDYLVLKQGSTFQLCLTGIDKKSKPCPSSFL